MKRNIAKNLIKKRVDLRGQNARGGAKGQGQSLHNSLGAPLAAGYFGNNQTMWEHDIPGMAQDPIGTHESEGDVGGSGGQPNCYDNNGVAVAECSDGLCPDPNWGCPPPAPPTEEPEEPSDPGCPGPVCPDGNCATMQYDGPNAGWGCF